VPLRGNRAGAAPRGASRRYQKEIAAMATTFESMLTASREREGELRLVHLLIDKIEPDPDQPRKHLDEAHLAELAASLRQDGILHPILVQPANEQGAYRIIAGERRWRASRRAGITRIPAFILRRDEIGRRRVQLVENLQRVDLTATERAQHVAMMRELLDLQAHAEGRQLGERELDKLVGDMLGMSDRSVRDFLTAVALPAPVQEVARQHALSIKHMRAAALVGQEHAEGFIAAVAEAHITGDQALVAARRVRDEQLPIAQALGESRHDGPASANDDAEQSSLPTTTTSAATETSLPQPEKPRLTMSRQRRTIYVRLLDVSRLLARLPLLEATDPMEAQLWIKALDALIDSATALRQTLRSLQTRGKEARSGDE